MSVVRPDFLEGDRGLAGGGIGQLGNSTQDDFIDLGCLDPDDFPEERERVFGRDRDEEDAGDFPYEPDDGGDFVGELAA